MAFLNDFLNTLQATTTPRETTEPSNPTFSIQDLISLSQQQPATQGPSDAFKSTQNEMMSEASRAVLKSYYKTHAEDALNQPGGLEALHSHVAPSAQAATGFENIDWSKSGGVGAILNSIIDPRLSGKSEITAGNIPKINQAMPSSNINDSNIVDPRVSQAIKNSSNIKAKLPVASTESEPIVPTEKDILSVKQTIADITPETTQGDALKILADNPFIKQIMWKNQLAGLPVTTGLGEVISAASGYKTLKEGGTLSAPQKEELAGWESKVKSIDDEIKLLKDTTEKGKQKSEEGMWWDKHPTEYKNQIDDLMAQRDRAQARVDKLRGTTVSKVGKSDIANKTASLLSNLNKEQKIALARQRGLIK